MKSYFRRILLFLIIFLALALVLRLDLFNWRGAFSFSTQKDKNSAIITERIEKLCNLSTVKYNYQEILDYKDSIKLGEMELPFGIGDKKALITYRAHITAGTQFIKLEKVNDEYVKVYLNKGQIFDNVLELDSIKIYDIQQGIFNKFNIEDDTALINEDMKKYEEENKQEILSSAEKNADETLESFLQTIGYKQIEVIFQ